MIRALAFALAVFAAGPVWAGCANYTDGSLSVPGPEAEICFKGECELTRLIIECGNAHGAAAVYQNGWVIRFGENATNGRVEVERSVPQIVPKAEWSEITCTDLDDGQACRFKGLQQEAQAYE